MKKQPHIRILAATLTLAFCLLGSSSALAAPAATPTTRPEKEVVEPNDTTQTSLDYLEFLLHAGGPFRFQEAAIKHPADDADAGPAEGAVAALTIYSQTTNNTEPIDISGHSFVAVRNVSDHAIEVGGQEIAPGTGVTIGTRANRPEHEGIWYNLEGYYCYYISAFYPNLYSMQVSLDEDGAGRPQPEPDHRRPLVHRFQLRLLCGGAVELRLLRPPLGGHAPLPQGPEGVHPLLRRQAPLQ